MHELIAAITRREILKVTLIRLKSRESETFVQPSLEQGLLSVMQIDAALAVDQIAKLAKKAVR